MTNHTTTTARQAMYRTLAAICIGCLIILGLCSCMGTMSKVEVEADRARWTTVRDVTADNAVDEQERQKLALALLAWDKKLALAEEEIGKARDPNAIFVDLLRVYGAAVVQAYLGPELLARAPEMFRLIDRNSDGVLSEGELASLDPRDPVVALVVVHTLHALLTRR